MSWQRLGGSLAGVLLALVGLWHAVVAPFAPLTRIELALEDLRQQVDPPAGVHPDIVIVDIDESSLERIGHWPWSRAQVAALSQELLQRQAVAGLTFDFVFPEPTPDDPALAQAWQGAAVTCGFYLSADRGGHRTGQLPAPLAPVPAPGTVHGLPRWNGHAANLPELARACSHAGFFNVVPDADGLVRSVPTVAQLDGQLYPSLTLASLLLATGDPQVRPAWHTTGPDSVPILSGLTLSLPGQAPRYLPLDEHGSLRVPFRGRSGPQGGSFRYIPAADVVMGQLPAGSLQGKLVLLGSSAPGISDLRPTPGQAATPGVEVHAHLLAGLLEGHLPYRPGWAPGYEALLITLTLATVGWLVGRRSAPIALAGATTWLLLLIASNYLLYSRADLVLPVASALVLGSLFALGLIVRNYLEEWQSRRSLIQLFDQYLPPERVRELARDPNMRHHEAANRELTILFCDLRSFSALGEQLPPLALRDLLNLYFSTVTRIVHAHGGTLDKFIGDAVMAFWGAPIAQPDHALRAVQAALALGDAVEPLNQALRDQGLPAIEYGIGLATGVVCVGDLGSQLRRSYTAVGDAVNLAARLEALTRQQGVQILIADTTRAACGDQLTHLDWLEVDQTQVRGRQQSVTVFTPLAISEDQQGRLRAQVHSLRLALAAARSQDAKLVHRHLAELFALQKSDTPTSAPSASASTSRVIAALARHLSQRWSSAPETARPNDTASS